MECCLGSIFSPFRGILGFSQMLPESGACGFWVYSAEPVKLVFAFGVDRCRTLGLKRMVSELPGAKLTWFTAWSYMFIFALKNKEI